VLIVIIVWLSYLDPHLYMISVT